MIGRGLALVARLKRERPEYHGGVRKEHAERAVEYRRLVEYLESKGYEIRCGYDPDLGDWAEARVDGKVVARDNRRGSVEACLRGVAMELGVEL